ncbi:chemotaxis protein CheW [Kaarinaea lacus]
MLYLQVSIAKDHFLIATDKIAAVIPLVTIEKISRSPGFVEGYMNYKGCSVPVIDLGELLVQKKSKLRLSTRIILIHYHTNDNRKNLLGLKAEKATDMLRLDSDRFTVKLASNQQTACLDTIASDGLKQWKIVTVEKMLDRAAEDLLFTRCSESQHDKSEILR